jgi:hypothetical protein
VWPFLDVLLSPIGDFSASIEQVGEPTNPALLDLANRDSNRREQQCGTDEHPLELGFLRAECPISRVRRDTP